MSDLYLPQKQGLLEIDLSQLETSSNFARELAVSSFAQNMRLTIINPRIIVQVFFAFCIPKRDQMPKPIIDK